jgi:site-specific DNA-methyltransferase (adenine-specific)
MIPRHPSGKSRVKSGHDNNGTVKATFNEGLNSRDISKEYDYKRYSKDFKNPSSILKFIRPNKVRHPTQKPVALMEYLIKTYTNENETVLDFTMGSGSTGVAAKNLNRNFIGIEQDENYFNIAQDRINNTLF